MALKLFDLQTPEFRPLKDINLEFLDYTKEIEEFEDDFDRFEDEFDRMFGGGRDEPPRPTTSSNGESKVRSVRNERLIGERNNIMSVEFLEAGSSASQVVGRILGSWFGTGFLVAPKILMTNHHVIPNPGACEGLFFQLNHEANIFGEPLRKNTFELDPDFFFATDSELDFTLVALAEECINEGGGQSASGLPFCLFNPEDDDVAAGSPVALIHHPGGEEKKLSVHDSFLTQLERRHEAVELGPGALVHSADTLSGSSGAPIFDQSWNIIGLHRSGILDTDEHGHVIRRNGGRFQDEQDLLRNEHEAVWIANLGTRSGAVRTRLEGLANLSETHGGIRDRLISLWDSPDEQSEFVRRINHIIYQSMGKEFFA